MSTVEVYFQGWGGGACKAIIMDSSGNIITNGVSSELTGIDYEDGYSWHSFTMGTPPTLTKSTNYRFGIVCNNADGAISLPFNDTGSDTFGYIDTDGTHSYATPGNMSFPLGHAVDDSATFGGFRGKK